MIIGCLSPLLLQTVKYYNGISTDHIIASFIWRGNQMPVITVTLIEGYEEEFRRRLSQRLTDTVRMFTGAPADGVTIVINEIDHASYMRGRLNRTPKPPPMPPTEIILSYLAAMESRNLELARSFLTRDFTMTFPGGAQFDSLDELLAWSADRYKFISKTITGVHEVPEEESASVYCMGTLAGEWPDGSPFSGIRFIDRFTVRDGKLACQQVWNDLAEARAPLSTETATTNL